MMRRCLPLLLCLLASPAFTAEPKGLPEIIGADTTDNAVSDRMMSIIASNTKSKKRHLDQIILDIKRSTDLPSDREQLLRIAASGAIAEITDNIRAGTIRDLNARAKGMPAKNVKKAIAGISSNYYMPPPELSKVWRAAVKQILTAEEKAKWDKVVTERRDYRAKAIAEAALVTVGPVVNLTPEQRAALKPLLLKAVSDFLPDVEGMYRSEDEGSEIYMPMLPAFIKGISEKDARAIIKPEQWKKWEQAPGEYGGEWQWIKQNHDERIKQEKEERKP